MQVDDVSTALAANGYLADEGLTTAIFLALTLHRPLLLEGEAGVGKTEVAKVLSRWTSGELIRLQCYEGIDVAQAVYEWDYSRQLLHLRATEAEHTVSGGELRADAIEDELYSERFLVRRPLLRAIAHGDGAPPVLLIDEVDRADDEFEAFLLEILAEYAITVPELGTFRAEVPPVVIITSNRTRDVHDALKRRCLYHWVEHPDFEREVAIVRLRAPGVPEALARQVAAATEVFRGIGLYKPPGVAETIDWAEALAALGRTTLDVGAVDVTLGTVLKYREDQERARREGLDELVEVAATRRVRPVTVATPEAVLVTFVGDLRRAGLTVPIGCSVRFTEAVALLGAADERSIYWAGRATLVPHPEDIATYDRVFATRWRGIAPVATTVITETVTVLMDDADDTGEGPEPDLTDELIDGPTVTVRFSPHEVLRHKDFALYSSAELDEARRLMADLRLAGSLRRSRRQRASRHDRGRPDVRRTVRQALRSGGEPVERRHLRPDQRPRRVVLLCDVSGSMEPYSRALLRFAHAAVVGRARVEAFALGTRLTRLTRELSSRDPDTAMAQAGRAVDDWSGGTRLGVGLHRFNDEWGVRGMARGAVVVILSDGWDRGDPDELAEQMARLHRVAHRIVWVNPLKASPGYEPLARGMAAALPHVDEFVEGHSLASLEELARVVAR